MKKIYIIVIFVLVFSSHGFSQTRSSSEKNEIALVGSSNANNSLTTNYGERIFTTGIILLEVAILLMVLYYWKKTRTETKKKVKDVYKNNIKALRNERIKPVLNKDISKKRRNLGKVIKMKSLTGKNIGSKAREHNISKGELYLAARIQKLQKEAS